VTPAAYQYFNQNFGFFGSFKNFWQTNINAHHRQRGNDFYEPRIAGLVYKAPENFVLNLNLATNRAKMFSGGIWYGTQWVANGHNGKGHDLEVFTNLRLSNKFSLGEDIIYSPRINYIGFATLDSAGTKPIFALRDVHTVENIFNIKYTFTGIMGLSARLRHYWSKLNNKEFYDLAKDGSIIPLTSTSFNHDVNQNFNTWNVDMIYVWQFSPGSELSIAWKVSSLTNTTMATQDYFKNLRNTLDQPQNNNVSFKILYYIDYQSLRKKKA
jgi:hypothetical protein